MPILIRDTMNTKSCALSTHRIFTKYCPYASYRQSCCKVCVKVPLSKIVCRTLLSESYVPGEPELQEE